MPQVNVAGLSYYLPGYGLLLSLDTYFTSSQVARGKPLHGYHCYLLNLTELNCQTGGRMAIYMNPCRLLSPTYFPRHARLRLLSLRTILPRLSPPSQSLFLYFLLTLLSDYDYFREGSFWSQAQP